MVNKKTNITVCTSYILSNMHCITDKSKISGCTKKNKENFKLPTKLTSFS